MEVVCQKVWADTMSYVNNFGESIGDSPTHTEAAHCEAMRGGGEKH